MKAQIQIYEDPAERRRRHREESKKSQAIFAHAFGERLTKLTADFHANTGRTFTHSELAAMLRELVGKPITPRLVGRWYRGLAAPRTECMIELAKIFGVNVGWLGWGEGKQESRTRGVYHSGDHFNLVGNHGETIITVSMMPDLVVGDDILEKIWELLDIVSPDQPPLRVVK